MLDGILLKTRIDQTSILANKDVLEFMQQMNDEKDYFDDDIPF